MLADPFVTKSGCSAATLVNDITLPTISRTDTSSGYRLLDFGSDGTTLDLFVGHQFARRNRVTLKFTLANVVADPLVSGVSSLISNSYYFVADESPLYLPANRSAILNALGISLLAVGAGVPVIERIIAGET